MYSLFEVLEVETKQQVLWQILKMHFYIDSFGKSKREPKKIKLFLTFIIIVVVLLLLLLLKEKYMFFKVMQNVTCPTFVIPLISALAYDMWEKTS